MGFRTVCIDSLCKCTYKGGYLVVTKENDVKQIHLSEISDPRIRYESHIPQWISAIRACRIRMISPATGIVSVLTITERQYASMLTISNRQQSHDIVISSTEELIVL